MIYQELIFSTKIKRELTFEEKEQFIGLHFTEPENQGFKIEVMSSAPFQPKAKAFKRRCELKGDVVLIVSFRRYPLKTMVEFSEKITTWLIANDLLENS